MRCSRQLHLVLRLPSAATAKALSPLLLRAPRSASGIYGGGRQLGAATEAVAGGGGGHGTQLPPALSLLCMVCREKERAGEWGADKTHLRPFCCKCLLMIACSLHKLRSCLSIEPRATQQDASAGCQHDPNLRSCIRDGRSANLVCGTLGGGTRNQRPATQRGVPAISNNFICKVLSSLCTNGSWCASERGGALDTRHQRLRH